MIVPETEIVVLSLSLGLAVLGFKLTNWKEPIAGLMMFLAGLYISMALGYVGWWLPVSVTVILALLLGWKYSRGGETNG
ncbi:unnamed protein product [marine sediment metagenome]|uniref:Uncharacterized protein n=1 Tax=marine sediment metagenome TaxID=412755 RepID=X1KRE9_9ZZZZ